MMVNKKIIKELAEKLNNAIIEKNYNIIEQLLQEGADINFSDNKIFPPLFMAYPDLEVMGYLLSKGARRADFDGY